MNRSLKYSDRPKAFWGAVIGAASSLLGSYINGMSAKKAAERQLAEQRKQLLVSQQENAAAAANAYLQNQDNTDDSRLLVEYRNGGKVKRRKLRNQFQITDGGEAIKIDNNTFFLRGGSHQDVNPSGHTGIGIRFNGQEIEAEGNEVVQGTNNGRELRIYSAQPMFADGSSPAERVLAGDSKSKVWNAQETIKRKLGIAPPVEKKAKWGMSITNSDYLNLGADALSALGNIAITNGLLKGVKYNYEIPQYIDETPVGFDTTYHNEAELAALERDRQRGRRSIARNSASSANALNRMQALDTDAATERNKLYDVKRNKETELRAKRAELESATRARNAAARNQYYQNVAQIRNQQIDANNDLAIARAQSLSANLSGLGTAVNNFVTQGQQRYQDENSLLAYLAGSKEGTAARLISMGYKMPNRVLKGLYDYELDRYNSNPTQDGADRLNLYGRTYYGDDYNPVSYSSSTPSITSTPPASTSSTIDLNNPIQLSYSTPYWLRNRKKNSWSYE